MLTTKITTSLANAACPQTEADAPNVSIIIVNYNGRSYLDACLQSVLAHSGPDIELILVDNQSTDGSAEYVMATYPQVQVIRNHNSGYGGGNNLAARFARGRFLVFLNPDTVVTSGWLISLLIPLIFYPRAGMTTPKIVLMRDPSRLNTAGNDMHLSGLTLCRGMGEQVEEIGETAVVSAISGAAFAIRRKLYQKLGGFDPNFFLYMEDTDLSLRVRLAGFQCLYVPDAVVHHDYTLRIGPQKTYYQERNRYIMLLKTWRWSTLLLLLPVLLLAELITWGFVLLQDRQNWRNKLAAYAYIGQHWAALLGRRQDVQAIRRIPDRKLLRETAVSLAFEQASSRVVAKAAHYLFDPFFFLWQRLLLVVIRW